MSNWFSGDVVANGIKIHYVRTGGNKPPMVLLHGFTDNGLCWTRAARVWEKEYDVVMYDARGHGFSDAPERGYSPEDHAVDVAGLIRALALENPRPILIGHSMGASTAATAAANYAELVRAVVLEDPPWHVDLSTLPVEARTEMMEGWRANIVDLQSKTRDGVIAAGRAQNPTWADAEWGPWADSKRQLNLRVFEMPPAPRTPWQDAVREIVCPALLVTADPEMGAIVTPQVAEEVTSLWHGQIVRIDGAGHNVRREQFEKYMAAVAAFLGKTE
jgi:pimeloyl-ACP methyl ester carboxylesterase